MALHRAPSALALNGLGCDGPRLASLYDGDVRLISLLDESSLADAEESGWIVAHQLHKALDGQHALVNQLEHCHERELNHRHT